MRGVPFNTHDLVIELRSLGFDESQSDRHPAAAAADGARCRLRSGQATDARPSPFARVPVILVCRSIAIMKTLLKAQEASLAKLIATYRTDLTTIKMHTDTNQTALKAQMEASQTNLISTYRSELSSLKEHLNEKTFNASLKTDMQQKHIRDSLKAELDAIKSDATDNNRQNQAQQAADRVAFQKLDKEIASIREAASASANQIALLASREELEKKQSVDNPPHVQPAAIGPAPAPNCCARACGNSVLTCSSLCCSPSVVQERALQGLLWSDHLSWSTHARSHEDAAIDHSRLQTKRHGTAD